MGLIVHVDHVVFAGGGNRCFWQAGFWSVAAAEFNWKPSRVASVSAGSATACALFSGTFEQGFADFKLAVAGHTYVHPSRPIPVRVWDYTNNAGLQASYDLGRRDGETFCALH